MLFTKVILSKYKRLSLNHIDYFEITPINKIQLILGTNGSGKSSVLSQITPLPANHQDYHRDGYKIVEILHNNSHYVLKSIFATTGNKFYFEKDGTELNDGLTTTTFKELVKQEFGITQDIQDMLTGSTNFHSMSVAERRNWFTKISDADYTYAIQYYNRLRERHRDMVGTIKIQQSRLVQESEKLLTKEDEEKYRFEINLFNEMLQSLLDMKFPLKTSKDSLNAQITDLEKQLTTLTVSFKQHYETFNNKEGFLSLDDIEAKSIELRSTEQVLESEIEKLCIVIEDQDKVMQGLKDNSLTTFSDVDNSIDQYLVTVQQLSSQNLLGLVFTDPNNAYQSLISITDNITAISERLSENTDRRFSRDNYTTALEHGKVLDNRLLEITNKVNQLTARRKELEHFKEHNKLECPNCKHIWHKGYEEFQYTLVLGQLETAINIETDIRQQIVNHEALIESIRTYLETYRDYINISRAWTDLNPLWTYLTQSSIIFDNPRKITKIVETLKGDLQVAIKLELVNKQLSDALSLKKTLHDNQETSVSSFIKHADELHEKLYNLNSQLQNTKLEVKRLLSYRDAVKQINSIVTLLESAIHNRVSKTDELINAAKTESLNNAIQLVQLELFDREQTISKMDMQRAVVMNIQLQITEFTEKAALLKIAIDELSPSQGLIAKGLTGFINHFVAQMNNFIKKIWLYPMELVAIIPDGEEGVDLDYKFAVRINDEADNEVPDISKGSAGMQEIIDLAFKVVNMSYLGLEKAPLVLDELGAKLDSAHRQSVQFEITNLITTSNFSQVFMVSHYENAYGSLKNADICVLHPSNINIPKNMAYNTHVKMS